MMIPALHPKMPHTTPAEPWDVGQGTGGGTANAVSAGIHVKVPPHGAIGAATALGIGIIEGAQKNRDAITKVVTILFIIPPDSAEQAFNFQAYALATKWLAGKKRLSEDVAKSTQLVAFAP
jgi:hypothetical protein